MDLTKEEYTRGRLRTKVLEEVGAEMAKQDSKWGAFRNHHPVEWNAILTEETGEFAKNVVDGTFTEDARKRRAEYQNAADELIQVAAVAIQAAISIRLYHGKKENN